MSSLFRYQVCKIMPYAQILRENRCAHVSLEFSNLEKMLKELDKIEAELKQIKQSIANYLPPSK